LSFSGRIPLQGDQHERQPIHRQPDRLVEFLHRDATLSLIALFLVSLCAAPLKPQLGASKHCENAKISWHGHEDLLTQQPADGLRRRIRAFFCGLMPIDVEM